MKKQSKNIEGVLSSHSRGFGFVRPLDSSHPDIFIPMGKMKDAIDGDTVIVEILGKTGKGFEGQIESVKSRLRKELVGLVADSFPNQDYKMHCPMLGEEKNIILQSYKEKKLELGDRILMTIKKVTPEAIVCSFSSFVASLDDTSMDTEVAIKEHLIKDSFSNAVMKEVEKFSISKEEIKRRTNFTKMETITIDPTTAKDFDDAISIEEVKPAGYRLYVHIADVSFFVSPGTAIDKEAYQRGNSTYFPDKVVPMIPSKLSDDLCSLKEGVDRLTVTVQMDFDIEGNMKEYKISRSVIQSNKRFTYEEAKEILDGKKKSPHENSLRIMQTLCNILKKKRSERGSIELNLPDMQLLFDKNSSPYGVKWHAYDETHQMIEEFMLKANETIATHVINQGNGGIFRVHESPKEDSLEDFFSFVRLLGFRVPPKPTDEDIQAIFLRAQNSPLLEQIAIRYIRSMKLAIYSSDPLGHYGLKLDNYSHFTSPIRRYADLVLHRLLFDEPYEEKYLKEISAYVSDQERKSFKAEASVIKLKKMRLLNKYFDEDPYRVYPATITAIKEQGILFDVDEIGMEGYIPIAKLGKEFYAYNPEKSLIYGKRSGRTFQLGSKLTVELEEIDLVYQSCMWVLSSHN